MSFIGFYVLRVALVSILWNRAGTQITLSSVSASDVEESESGCENGVCMPIVAVVGGTAARPGQFPWMVSIQRSGNHICGGVLISHRLVLSAAHCFHDKTTHEPVDAGVITAVLGAYDLASISTAVESRVERILLHRYYRPQNPNGDFDIALVELERSTLELEGAADLNPIDLPPANQNVSDLRKGTLRILGWGFQKKDGRTQLPTELQTATVNYITYPECQRRYTFQNETVTFSKFKVTAYVLCTDSKTADVCQGDSGGPLVLETNEQGQRRSILVGIISRSSPGCGRRTDLYSASIYTRISKFMTELIEPELQRTQNVSDRNAFLWAVSIQVRNKHACSGALISANLVLTAAHCLIDGATNSPLPPDSVTLVIGVRDLSKRAAPALKAGELKINPYFRPGDPNLAYDVAIISLESAVTDIQPVKLPSSSLTGKELAGKKLRLLGWRKEDSRHLLPFGVTYIKYSECQRRFESRGRSYLNVSNHVFCAESGFRDVCRLDEGGPIIIEADNKNEEYLVGISSVVARNCDARRITVVASLVPKFLDDFINSALPEVGDAAITSNQKATGGGNLGSDF